MTQPVNPDDFIIARKRKKYKFAKFHNALNCLELEQWVATPPAAPDYMEIGAGTGLFSVELAARYPHKQFVAVDVKADRLQKGAYTAIEKKLDNIWFVRARADQIDQLVSSHSLEAIWLTFPDPFPRERSVRRRMTHPIYLEKYAGLLSPTGSMYLKHDNRDFFCWSLEQLVATQWQITELTFDLHESDAHGDYKIRTTYEDKWLSEGLVTNFVKASR